MMERSPRAPVLRSMARLAMADIASSGKVSFTPSISNSRWYWRTSAFLGSCRIVTSAGTDPRVQAICQTLEQHLPVQVLAVEPFVQLEGPADLGRFSRYWRRAEREVWAGWDQEV